MSTKMSRSRLSSPSLLLPVLLVLMTSLTRHTDAQQVTRCDRKTDCSCDTDAGVIDLAPLASNPPRSIPGQSTDETFFYSPCKNFDYDTVTNAGMVQQNGGGTYEIGTNSDTTTISGIDPSSGLPYFVMISSDTQRMAQVACSCDQSQEFSAQYNGETTGPPISYNFVLTSKFCCPGYAPSGGDGDIDGMSIGSILVIAFFVLFITYFAAGIAVQKVVRKASGSEVIPNSGFWKGMPGLILDGMKFTVKCGRKGNYSSI